LPEQGCFVVGPNTEYTAKREEGSIGLVVTQHPLGNKGDRPPAAKRACLAA